jgi:hypothetical protein
MVVSARPKYTTFASISWQEDRSHVRTRCTILYGSFIHAKFYIEASVRSRPSNMGSASDVEVSFMSLRLGERL